MAPDWVEMALGDFVELKRGYDLPKSQRKPGKVPIISSGGISDYHSIAKLPGPGVVTGRYGTLGQVFYVEGEYWPLNTALYVKDFKGNDPRFVSYFLRTLDFLAYSDKAAVPGINRNHLHQARVIVPVDVDEQRRIAHILGTLDDKIELNRRMNETLEEMARALFKSWFVDFDPVRAKAVGRDPGLPKHLASLFPDRLVDSELGEIPDGWTTGPLGEFFKVGLGGAWGESARSDKASAEVRCLRGIDLHDLAEGSIPDVPTRWLSPKQAEARSIPNGTILVEGSGSFCGRSLLWGRGFSEAIEGPAVYSNFCKRLDPLVTKDQAAVVWMQMRAAYSAGVLQSFRTGTAFPNLDIHGLLSNFWVILPPPTIASAYVELGGLGRSVSGPRQAITLGAIRDALMVQIMSVVPIPGE